MDFAHSRGRRQHTKSRKGCNQCRSRKVKCDETHPECLNCCRLGISCNFRDAFINTSASPSVLTPKCNRNDGATRVLDMRLLHYYVTSACATFPLVEDQQVHNYWSITVPTMAFENDCLLDALLGATALHMSVRLPQDTQLSEVAFRYQSSAVSKLRHALSSVTAKNAEPLCAASILTMLTTLTMSNIALTGEHYTPPARWFRIIYGMGCLIRYSQPFLRDDGIRMVQNKEYVFPTKGLLLNKPPYLPDLDELLARGDLETDIKLDQDTKTSRLKVWKAVNQCYSSAVAGASRHLVRYRLLAIAATNDEPFLRLVEDQDGFTMIILSHYFALLEWCGGNWFLQHALNSQLVNLRAVVPSEYQWATAKPYSED